MLIRRGEVILKDLDDLLGLSSVEIDFHTHLSNISNVDDSFTRISNAIYRFKMPTNELLINHWEERV
ncbi:hypothetical protein MKY29_09470 [Psychrobacillus sp. FSL K6-2365]|uniref:hypothetical protein n=1 Tax=Psychrobacillus sp. FSL K6-2365 TaxID=2921546 RepID=UPI0030FD06AB